MKTNYKERFTLRDSKGFTLIELLVVITIIGILAAVVISSIGTSRAKAKDASLKESLSAVRSQAENNIDPATGNYPDGSGSTVSLCAATGSALDSLFKAIKANVPSTSPFDQTSAGSCAVSTTAFRVSATLNLGVSPKKSFCVDSNGYSGVAADAQSGTACTP